MCFCLFLFTPAFPGREDAPAALRLKVHLVRGGAEARRETRGGATVHTGHAAGTGGSTIVHIIHSTQSAHSLRLLYYFQSLEVSYMGFKSDFCHGVRGSVYIMLGVGLERFWVFVLQITAVECHCRFFLLQKNTFF